MQPYLCTAATGAVVYLCTNKVAAENAAFNIQEDIVRVANASIGLGQKVNQGIDNGPRRSGDEFILRHGALEVAEI